MRPKVSRHDQKAAEARVRAVTDWMAAREDSSPPAPEAIEAAAAFLALPPTQRDESVRCGLAVVHHVSGHMVAVWHERDALSGPVFDAVCSCGSDRVCEHLLIALAPAQVGKPA